MRITIDYEPKTNDLSVLVDRGALSNGDPPWPPPPPTIDEFTQLTSWLNTVYGVCMEKFIKDQSVGAIRFKYIPSTGKQIGFSFVAVSETPPPPPPFIK